MTMPFLQTPTIPTFPNQRNIAITDKKIVEKYVNSFPPYSDYNFMSLFTWNIKNCIFISQLNGNLIIKFDDYISRQTYYSFLGNNHTIETATQLLDVAQKNGLPATLKLIPEASVTDPNLIYRYRVEKDRDNFDYVYNISDMINLKGATFAVKRNFIHRFIKNYSFSHRLINVYDPRVKKGINALLNIWRENRQQNSLSTINELTAIQRALEFASQLDILAVGLYVDNRMIGFSINNLLPKGYAMNLFEKADVTRTGAFPFLRHITCSYLAKYDRKWLNFESDIGVLNLRKSKLSYHPNYFLKKYTIKNRS